MSQYIKDLQNEIEFLKLEVSTLMQESHSLRIILKNELEFKLENSHTIDKLMATLHKVIIEKEPLSTSSYLAYTDYHHLNHN